VEKRRHRLHALLTRAAREAVPPRRLGFRLGVRLVKRAVSRTVSGSRYAPAMTAATSCSSYHRGKRRTAKDWSRSG
jgi:hypothetical protein